jgi:stress-induced morphogen
MADSKLKRKIRKVLKDNYFKASQDLVDVSDGEEDDIHLVVVSRKFDGRRMKEKSDMIWSVLVEKLSPEEWGKITLTVGTTPEEIKAI